MGKGMNFKPVRHNQRPVTLGELEEAQKMVHDDIRKAREEACLAGANCAGAVVYLALHRAYGFGMKRAQRVLDEQEKIMARVQDDSRYDIDNVFDDLINAGIYVNKFTRFWKRDGYYRWHNLKKNSREVPPASDRYTVYYTYREDGRLCGAYGAAWWHDGAWYACEDHTLVIADGYRIIGWRQDDRFEGEI